MVQRAVPFLNNVFTWRFPYSFRVCNDNVVPLPSPKHTPGTHEGYRHVTVQRLTSIIQGIVTLTISLSISSLFKHAASLVQCKCLNCELRRRSFFAQVYIRVCYNYKVFLRLVCSIADSNFKLQKLTYVLHRAEKYDQIKD